jgi:hypothetical protein
MNEVTVTVHKLGTVSCALSGKETDGLVATFGDFKQTPLSWRSFKSLLKMKFHQGKAAEPKTPQPVSPNGK